MTPLDRGSRSGSQKKKSAFYKHDRFKGLGLFVVGLLGFALVAYFLKGALIPLILAWVFAYLLTPTIDWLVTKGFKEKNALWVVYLGTLSILGLIFLVLVPRLVFEGVLFVQHLPVVLKEALEEVETFILSLHIPGLQETHLRQLLQKQIESVSFTTITGLSGIMNAMGSQILGVAVSIANYTLFPIFFYYMLLHFKRLKLFFLSWIPGRWQSKTLQILAVGDHVFSGYVRGQVTVSAILAILYAIGLSLAGLKYGAIIGITTGLLNIVPYFGFGIGLLSGGLIALFSGLGILHLLLVLLVFILIQTIESFFLTPRIVGHNVGLDPFLAILALIIGGNFLGIFGMLIAVPLAAILKVGYDTWMKQKKP
jgi:predicted PurR-regulated permease PerM